MKICSDTCPYCIYIGEGDFVCDIVHDIVIEDWTPSECVTFKMVKFENGKITNME